MKTYKEFIKLFEATKLRPDWRIAFENAFSLKNEVVKKNELKKLIRAMNNDVLPKQMVQYIETMLKQWAETSDPETQEKIERTILNTIFIKLKQKK